MTWCCRWFIQPAIETTRNENGSTPPRIAESYHVNDPVLPLRAPIRVFGPHDMLQLMLVHPAGNGDNEKRKWVENRDHSFLQAITQNCQKTQRHRVFAHCAGLR